jgi:hypothetical protein
MPTGYLKACGVSGMDFSRWSWLPRRGQLARSLCGFSDRSWSASVSCAKQSCTVKDVPSTEPTSRQPNHNRWACDTPTQHLVSLPTGTH